MRIIITEKTESYIFYKTRFDQLQLDFKINKIQNSKKLKLK